MCLSLYWISHSSPLFFSSVLILYVVLKEIWMFLLLSEKNWYIKLSACSGGLTCSRTDQISFTAPFLWYSTLILYFSDSVAVKTLYNSQPVCKNVILSISVNLFVKNVEKKNALDSILPLYLLNLLLFAATTLTGFHFAVTAIVGMISNATGLSTSKHVPFWELLWFSIVANMSITGMNLSLMLNSVGFYQVWFINTPNIC